MAERSGTAFGFDSSKDEPSLNEAPSNIGPRIFLGSSSGGITSKNYQLTGPLGFIARLINLDIYGDSILTGPAVSDMKIFAVTLSVITIFDFFAWSFLWNAIFYNNPWGIGLITPLALVFGGMFAAIVFVYERSWVIRDLTGGFSRETLNTYAGLVFRFAMIGIAAYIQAQPIEYITFNSAIQRRVHEESVRQEAARRLRELEDAERKTHGAIAFKDTTDQKNADDAQTAFDEATKNHALLKTKADSTRAAVQAAQNRLEAARRSQYWKGKDATIAKRQAALTNATKAANDADLEYKSNQEILDQKAGERDLAKSVLSGLEASAKDEVQRIRDWVTRLGMLQELDPELVITEDTKSLPAALQNKPAFFFKDAKYDFFDRMSVIDDLCVGRSPRWIDVSNDDKDRIDKLFGLSDSEGVGSERRNQAATYTRWWWGILGVSIFIPGMVFAVKLFMRQELKNYYSRKAQQNALNPDAFLVEETSSGFEVRGRYFYPHHGDDQT